MIMTSINFGISDALPKIVHIGDEEGNSSRGQLEKRAIGDEGNSSRRRIRSSKDEVSLSPSCRE